MDKPTNLDIFYSDDYKWVFEYITCYITQHIEDITITFWFDNSRYFKYDLGETKYVDKAELTLTEYEYIILEIESRTNLSAKDLKTLIIYEH